MASFYEKHADKYAARLRDANDPETALARVVEAINALEYPGTDRRLSHARKQEIVDLIAERLDGEGGDAGHGIAREGDNRRYLDMVRMLRALFR